ncbi:hypothetical protein [Chryseobacterium sp. MP_3.2]|uniref:hypothetical protein n=1 Tax=Chryseobacterium sp. MP_3.2 TaxID=3071712 RepID=UPI002DF78D45|nr:hypothetical protein [Chryseobacterium sp. MP_3.2]
MKKISFIIACTVLLYSCETKKTTAQENTLSSSADSATAVVAGSTAIYKDGSANVETATPGNAVAATLPSAASAPTSGKPALNPEHGKPFHRCEIPVGAPIDSAPQQNAAPQVAAPPMQSSNQSFNTNPISAPTVAPVAAPQASGPKPAMNPAHGLPHHRCDLQVGAPLT